MFKSIIYHTSILTVAASLVACAPAPLPDARPLPPNNESKPPKVSELNNEGALCVGRRPNKVKVLYLPLESTCASSSRHDWQNPRLNVQEAGRAIQVNSSITHIEKNSMIATSDCAGAYMGRKELPSNYQGTQAIFWGGRPVGRLPAGNNALMCVSVDAQGKVSPAPQLVEQVKSTFAVPW